MQEPLLPVANIGPIGFYLNLSTKEEKGSCNLIGAADEVPEERQGREKQMSE